MAGTLCSSSRSPSPPSFSRISNIIRSSVARRASVSPSPWAGAACSTGAAAVCGCLRGLPRPRLTGAAAGTSACAGAGTAAAGAAGACAAEACAAGTGTNITGSSTLAGTKPYAGVGALTEGAAGAGTGIICAAGGCAKATGTVGTWLTRAEGSGAAFTEAWVTRAEGTGAALAGRTGALGCCAPVA